MKKTFAKLSFQALLAMFFVLGGLLLTNRAEAQLFQKANPNLNWKSSSEAIDIMKQQVESINLQIVNFTPASPEYKNLFLHVVYFKGIQRELVAGESVADAANKAIPAGNASVGQQSNATLHALFDEAVSLLTQ